MTDKNLQIMECTLRDGSYAINFQFTASDTSLIAQALETAGFDLIEIGHGIGLGASDAGMGDAAETDETYMQVAAKTLTNARWGMFCIPGIARLEHVDMAADHGMNFIRIGTNVDDVPDSRPFIERAKKHGMMVCANFMKSYARPPETFAARAAESVGYGADVIYLVDSSGGMLTENIRPYFDAVRARTDVRLGFHGHNNLGLGVANAVKAVDLGATIVDTTLQGFGRSAGNTPTEHFVCVLARRGIYLGMDPIDVMDLGEKFIVPLITNRGMSSMDIVSGLAQFHSSYMRVIREFATKYEIDPRRLIMAVCARNTVDAPRDLVEAEAKRLAEESASAETLTARFHFERYFGSEQQ